VIKYFQIIIISCALQIANAQEKITSITTNEVIAKGKSISLIKKTRAINLPFVDDFSQSTPYPDAVKWMDKSVFINNTFGIDMVTQGVATFDALNEKGRCYHPNGIPNSYKADSLTSQPIALGGIQAADSVYLSFFIQPQGNGFQPDIFDSLVLQLLDNNSNWIQIWGQGGAPYTNFKQIMIPITSSIFFHNDFQFRFINIASPNSNDDVWNIDYVRLAKNRTKSDTVLNDIAFTQAPSYLSADYTSMPYRHFINNLATEQASSFACSVQNNYKVANTVGVNVLATQQNSGGTLHTNIVNLTVPSGLQLDATFAQYTIAYNPPSANDDVTIRHKYFYNKLNAQENTANDTIVKDNVFSNYFAYDDGSNEKAYYLLGIANTTASTALGFHLNQADTIRGLAIRFANQVPSGEGKKFSITLYQSLGINSSSQVAIYTQDLYQVQYGNSIDEFSTYKFDSVIVLPAGNYFIGTNQAPNIGADSIYFGLDANTKANLNHFFYNVDGNWTPSIVKGTTMMRPLVGNSFTPTVIQSVLPKSAISIYPNPTNCNVHLMNNKEAVQYVVIDMLGKIVQQHTIQDQTIDVQQLPVGQYFIMFKNSKQQIIQQLPFTKQ
jgi:Secretion system C-terminal sorting domain